ncbi:hypothetical protein AMS68_003701 [Peltaster fructicola]|uniref:Phosphoglycerate mutase n=1 Tax=Peltaster fructicola TaxID=286661 RepID=A0A6H0XTX3_9PEZI|nr:hypothetical protein AMS68_003701 [Peltaster fructicola]
MHNVTYVRDFFQHDTLPTGPSTGFRADHWAMIDGDSESSWADARLTSKGEIEAMDLGRFWTRDMLPRGVPFPEQLYSSPLTRCIQTVTLASQALDDNEKNHNKDAPSIRVAECLRETLGVHTCDRRSTRSDLATSFPHLMFDEDFTENDELWQTDHRESFEECTARLTVWLQKLFAEDASDVLLVAAHSGSIRALLRAAGHPDVWPGRGSINPLLLKAEVV